MPAITFGFTAQAIVDEGRITWEDIDLMKTWLLTENFPKLTDEQIVCFLLSCFNEQKATKDTIKAFYSIRNKGPDIFSDRNINRPDIQKQINVAEICLIPQRTDDGCLVVLGRLSDSNYWNWDFGPCVKIFYMMLDSGLYENPPTGLIICLDLKGLGLMHLTRLKIGILKTLFHYLQEGLPMRLEKIHVFNTPYFIDKLLFIIKPFASKHVMDSLVFHSSNVDMEMVYEKCVPRKCLPEDYGGDQPSVRVLHQKNVDRLIELESHFQAEELQRQDHM